LTVFEITYKVRFETHVKEVKLDRHEMKLHAPHHFSHSEANFTQIRKIVSEINLTDRQI